jgi:putrescine transport system ATP-binding protein
MTSARSSSGFAKRGFEPWADRNLQPLLRIEVVSKRFGEFLAVNQLSLEVYQGEFFALLGPSGCGKTTLLRLVAGFEQPSTGRILLDGVDLAPVPPHRRPVNMMFQSYALFPHLTVEGNVAFGLKQEGLPKNEIAARVADVLALVKLESFGRRKPHELSGGQRQRWSSGRACFCSTNRWRHWIKNYAAKRNLSLWTCSAASDLPSLSSPTIKAKR